MFLRIMFTVEDYLCLSRAGLICGDFASKADFVFFSSDKTKKTNSEPKRLIETRKRKQISDINDIHADARTTFSDKACWCKRRTIT